MVGKAVVDIWTADDDSGSSDSHWEHVLEGIERELRAIRDACAEAATVGKNGAPREYNPR